MIKTEKQMDAAKLLHDTGQVTDVFFRDQFLDTYETIKALYRVVRAAEKATVLHGPACKFPIFGMECSCHSADLMEALAPFRPPTPEEKRR